MQLRLSGISKRCFCTRAGWAVFCAFSLGAGCATRHVGQVEPFTVGQDGKLGDYSSAAPPSVRTSPVAKMGDRIRSTDDVITLQIENVYLRNLPVTLSGSKDVVIFVDVWEDAAAGYNSPSLTSIVYVGRNQLVPGMLNFRDALAYGPTYYKGHPLRIRFTVLVLQKEKSEKQASAVDVVGTIASAAVPGYGALIGEAAKALKALLKAQKDVVAFDFELTMLADRPEEFRTPIPTGPTAQGRSQDLTPSTALVYSQPHWLRYGDYLIMETIDRSRTQNLVNDVLGDSLQFKNGRLTRQNQLVPANYLAFRITPNQKAEEDQTLAAASQANATFLKSIQRSAEDVKTAMDDLQNAAKSLQGEVLSIRAKSLARATANRVDAMHLTADAAKAEFTQQFTNRWSTLIGGLDAPTQKTAKAIGETISLRFADQYSPTPAPAAGDVASDLSSKLIDKSVTVNERPFTIASAPIKVTAAGNLPNTIPLTLKPDPSSLHVKKADLRLALVTLCDKEAKKLSSAARIDSVTIQNESAIPNLDD